MIAYKMWNRQTENGCEVCTYDENYCRLDKKEYTKEEAELILGEWVSPLDVYHNTNGKMDNSALYL